MHKPNNYENTRMTGEFTPIEVGGHKAIVKQVTEMKSKTGKDMIVVIFDFAKDDRQPLYFGSQFDADIRPDKRWPFQGVAYIVVEGADGNCTKNFKGFVSGIEESNPGIVIAWNAKFADCFKNRSIGAVFGEEEYENRDGEIKTGIKLRYFCSADAALTAKVPKKKTLQKKSDADISSGNPAAVTWFTEDDGLPF